ncbi:MAG: archease [Candidatus Aenigmarchaeota archaeon]|nr:archease [Candidatus Aenigmarchaeota archaeon]
MSYKFLEDIAIADVAFEADGKTIENMFEQAGLALENTMVKELETVKTTDKRKITAEGKDTETLLHNFLEELVYIKDAELLLFSKFSGTKIAEKNGKWFMETTGLGEPLNQKKHELLVDVKAVSWHKFSVSKVRGGFKSTVILDI